MTESGLQLSQDVADRIYAGQTRQVLFDTVIHNAVHGGRLDLRYVPQPRLVPTELGVTVTAAGWTLTSPATWNGVWDRALTITWTLHR